MPFDYDLDYENLDLRKKPELYHVIKRRASVYSVRDYLG